MRVKKTEGQHQTLGFSDKANLDEGPHVADRLRAKGADRRRRGKDLHAREESGELRTESPLDAVLCRIVGQQ